MEDIRAFKGTVVKIWKENGRCLDAGTDPKLLTTVGLTLLDLGITVCRLLDILLDSTAASPQASIEQGSGGMGQGQAPAGTLKGAGNPTGSIKPKSGEKVEVAASTCSPKGPGKSAGSSQQESSDKAQAGLSAAGTPKEAGTPAAGETPDSVVRSPLDVEVSEESLKKYIAAHKNLLTMGALF